MMKQSIISAIAIALLVGSTATPASSKPSLNKPAHLTLQGKDNNHSFTVPVESDISFELNDFMSGWTCRDPKISGNSVKEEMGSTNSIPPHFFSYYRAVSAGKSTITFTCFPPSKPGEAQRKIEAIYEVQITVTQPRGPHH